MFHKKGESKELGIETLPIIVGLDRKRKSHMAHMVLEKGRNPFAIAMVSREIELAGYNRLILKTDQEPAILELMAMAKRERPEDVEIIPEQSLVGNTRATVMWSEPHKQLKDKSCACS